MGTKKKRTWFPRTLGLGFSSATLAFKEANMKHGMWGTPEYWIWRAMISRCHRKSDPGYKNYGGRGIRVCSRWRKDFAAFIGDVGRRPDPKLTLDRIDNDRGYEPGNVRWATRREQNFNRRSPVHTLTIDGETKPLVEWADEAGISRQLLRKRVVKMGWSPKRAISTPVDKSMARRRPSNG